MSGTITTRPPTGHQLPHRVWHIAVALGLALAAIVAVALLVLAVRDGGATDEPSVPAVDAPAFVAPSRFECEPAHVATAC
jgi:hypothetical protein